MHVTCHQSTQSRHLPMAKEALNPSVKPPVPGIQGLGSAFLIEPDELPILLTEVCLQGPR